MYKISINDSTPVAMLTLGQLKMELAPIFTGSVTVQNNDRRYAYGLRGIATTFDCSIPTAQRIKSSGIIDDALVQTGRKIVIDVDKALELAGRKTKGG